MKQEGAKVMDLKLSISGQTGLPTFENRGT